MVVLCEFTVCEVPRNSLVYVPKHTKVLMFPNSQPTWNKNGYGVIVHCHGQRMLQLITTVCDIAL